MAKRTNGEGTIYQDKTGLWRGELTIGYDENKKRIKKQFSSMDLEVLQKKINDEKFRLNRNIVTVSSDFTIKEWIEFWLTTYKKNIIKTRTYDYYETALRLYLYEAIGNIKVDKLKSTHIQQMYNNLHTKGYSTSTIESVHKPLRQSMDQAINNDLIHKNPCNGVVIPKKEARESRAMTIEEQEKFINACAGTTYHNFFIFLLNTGMRCGEAMAITWDDIDFNNQIISVNKTVSRVISREENAPVKNLQSIETTKTESGNRLIPINNKCLSVLNKQSKNSLFVFSSKTGTLLGHRNIGRAFMEILVKADIAVADTEEAEMNSKEQAKNKKTVKKKTEKIHYNNNGLTVHSLRHTFATRLLEKGANIKAVSELLGHKGIQITLDTYSHVLPNFKKETMDLLN